MFSYQSSLFSLSLSRDSYIRLSHPLVFVKHFFHLFLSDFLRRSLKPMRKTRLQDCHSVMFCADSYQRNVLYIITTTYKCQQLFLTFFIFFRVFSSFVFSAFLTCFATLFSAAMISGFQNIYRFPAVRRLDIIPTNNTKVSQLFYKY